MHLTDIPFGVTTWADVPATRHPGERGEAVWRERQFGAVRVRMVEYSPGYLADHWCEKGHILLVLAGQLDTELADGRTFTLRPGDSVVLDGKVRTFMGGSRFPYSPRDFRDFRAADLSKSQRREIDERVGISRLEAQARTVRRQMLLREASLHDDTLASDANERFVLRGTLDPVRRGPVRMISLIAD